MATGNVKATYINNNKRIEITLTVYSWEENGILYMYSPALDLTGYGTSKKEADQSFKITLGEFIKYTHNKKTIFEELERLGWTVNRKKKRVNAPTKEELLQDNEVFRKLSNKKNIKHYNQPIAIPV
ncbi:MAG: hypothetical protein J0M08_07115 [Bacteroidetes bacterium]|nr:hypothetical protein [Bacteroidota bacterium]